MSKSTFVKASELAQEFQITEATLYRWVKDGKFPAPLRLGLRHYVWLRVTVDLHIEQKQREADAADHN